MKAWIDGADYPAYDATCEQPTTHHSVVGGEYDQSIAWDGSTLQDDKAPISRLRQNRD